MICNFSIRNETYQLKKAKYGKNNYYRTFND